jgi:ADP-heptose:LPS heptosyltransferase
LLPLAARPPLRERATTALTRVLAWAFSRWSPPPSLERLYREIPGGDHDLQRGPRILVLKPCCLGDVLMTTPALGVLRENLPRARVTFGVGSHARLAIASSPLVAGVLDTGPVGTVRPRSPAYLAGYLRLWSAMRAGRFDACLVLDRSPLLTILPWLAGIPIRAGIDSAGRGFALNLRTPWAATVHECDLYLSVVGTLGFRTEGAILSFVSAPADEAAAATLWEGLSKARTAVGASRASAGGSGGQPAGREASHGEPPRPVIALAPGGGVNPGMSFAAKRWPAGRYAELGQRLAETLGATIVVVGGPEDAALTAAVTRELAELAGEGRAAVWDLGGRTTLGALGAILRRCDVFVGSDSAPMHLAAAVGCPVVGLFGPTNPAMYAPYSKRAVVVQPDAATDAWIARGDPVPALARGAPRAPSSAEATGATEHEGGVARRFAIEGISVESVWAACLQRLEGPR